MALYIQETGAVGAQPILFLHPGLVSGWMWQELAKEFADYHCLMPDLPGHGNSSQVEWISFQDTANQVAEVLRERAPGKRAHVVGYSLGAYTTVHLLAAAPELVDHAIICGAAVRPLPGSALVMNRLIVRFIKSKFLWNGLARMWGIPPEEHDAFIRIGLSVSQSSYGRINDELANVQLPVGLAGANCPTLIVAGEKEPKAVVESIGDLMAALPNTQGYLAPQGDHYWGFRYPEMFVGMVQAWVKDGPLPQELIPVTAQS
ncbi:MAG: alpha/beta fold hydrolase [Anaerolineae bacterium]|nr:alpha/beta fold hydrolase [Anaerolineae bacterium]